MPSLSPVTKVWKTNAPPRVVAFGWLVTLGKVLTMDNIKKRNVILVNRCPMCFADVESADHLFLSCRFAHSLWMKVVGWFECAWFSLIPSVGFLKNGDGVWVRLGAR